jgi:hypothetical protein
VALRWTLAQARRAGLVVALLTVGCSSGTPNTSPAAASPTIVAQTVVVTRDAATQLQGCSVKEVATTLVDFTTAFSRGEVNLAVGSVSENFDRFGIGGKGGGEFASVGQLRQFAVSRHAHKEIWLIQIMDVSGPAWFGGVGVSIQMRRLADDLGSGLTMSGKASILCPSRMIQSWELGTGPLPSKICPEPLEQNPMTVIACARASG